MIHSNSVKNHKIESYTYASAAARNAATGFLSADIGKLAYQTDNQTYWRLTATTPTWIQAMAGPAGADGADGADGDDGAAGPGVPTGGTANQVLAKINGTNYNTQWVNPAGSTVILDVTEDGDNAGADVAFVDIASIPATAKTLRITGWFRTYNHDFDDVIGELRINFNGHATDADYFFSTLEDDTLTSGAGAAISRYTATSGKTRFVITIPLYSEAVFPSAICESQIIEPAAPTIVQRKSAVSWVGAGALAITDVRLKTNVARLNARVYAEIF